MERVKSWQPTERGTPQGAVISPVLANIYLDPLDWEMARAGLEMVRSADEYVVLSQSREEALQALEKIQEFAQANGLTLHPEKTQIVDASQPGGFDFLGYHFERGHEMAAQEEPGQPQGSAPSQNTAHRGAEHDSDL